MDRRNFLAVSAISLSSGLAGGVSSDESFSLNCQTIEQPAFSITPVVGDGKWIWRNPPEEKGYLEPRKFDVSIGMKFIGTGEAVDLHATTVVPVPFPEQKILDFQIVSDRCEAGVVRLDDGAAQLSLRAKHLVAGQSVTATAKYRLQISKSWFGFEKDQFPTEQTRVRQVPNRYLNNSPGIKKNSVAVKRVVADTISPAMHPWDKARRFHQWVWENIAGTPGRYTSVEAAIKNGKGDCEERACTFIALCRAVGIPARQVWVPSHVWAEIALHDHDGNWFWIPVHTAAYNWFGWTGAHEVVLQKGDRIRIESRHRNVRLVDDWYQLQGPRPKRQFICEITPIPSIEGGDAGPGGRRKLSNGQWTLTGNHAAAKFMRDR